MAYATAEDVAGYVGATIDEARAARLLDRAAELVDCVTFGRCDPASDAHATALKLASCAQVEYWLGNDEQTDFDGPLRSQMTGRTLTTYAGNGPAELAPRAQRILMTAGLLGGGVKLS